MSSVVHHMAFNIFVIACAKETFCILMHKFIDLFPFALCFLCLVERKREEGRDGGKTEGGWERKKKGMKQSNPRSSTHSFTE